MGTTPTTSGGKHFLRRSEAADYVANHYGFPCSRQWLAWPLLAAGRCSERRADIPSTSRVNWTCGRKRASGLVGAPLQMSM